MTLRLSVTSASFLSFAVVACGGGDGGGGEVASTPPPPIRQVSLPSPMPAPATKPTGENFDTAEFRNSSAAVGSNAIGAWEQGATGKNITIGFVDTGLVPTLSDFYGRIDPASRDFNGTHPMGDSWGHGTAIAGIAAAAHDGSGMEGIAFEATIFMAKADQGCPEHCIFPYGAVANGIDAATAAGAKVINLSIAGSESSEIRAAVQRAVDAGVVIVIGAGNSGPRPSDLAMQLALTAPSQVIIVGGLGVSNPDGTINYDVPSIYTTPAGSSSASFLTAPGWLNSATYFKVDGGIDKLSGTSFAAPVVTGAIALLAQAFPMLTPEQMVLILYKTADDLGAPGIDPTFGQGRLNIGRAFQPIGTARLANNMQAVPKSIGSLPAAARDAAKRGSLKATILDDFQRPFDMNLAASLIEIAEPGPLYRSFADGHYTHTSTALGPVTLALTVDDATARRGSFGALHLTPEEEKSARLLAATAITKLTNSLSLALGFGVSASSLRDSQRPVADFLLSEDATSRLGFGARGQTSVVARQKLGGWGVSALAERGSVASFERREHDPDYSLLGIEVDRQIHRGRFHFGLSQLIEPETMLGSRLDSMFGGSGALTWFADAAFNRSFGNGWSLGASARRGWTALSSGRFLTSAYSADVAKAGIFTATDAISIRIAQPLRVEGGSLAITLPASWDYKTQTFTEASRQLNLMPSGRERFFEIGYLRNMQKGWVSFHLYRRIDPGHIDDGRSDLGGAIRANLSL